jgi:hypothetical protein
MPVAEVPGFKFCQGAVVKNILINGNFYTFHLCIYTKCNLFLKDKMLCRTRGTFYFFKYHIMPSDSSKHLTTMGYHIALHAPSAVQLFTLI